MDFPLPRKSHNQLKDDGINQAKTIRKILEMEPVRVIPTKPLDKERAKKITRSFGTMENQTDKRIVMFPVDTIGKIFGHGGFRVSTILTKLKNLYETSIPAWSEPEIAMTGHKERRNVLAYHNYVNKFTDGMDTYFIRFTVREMAPAKKGNSRAIADNHIHSTVISDITVYSTNGTTSRRIPEQPGLDEILPFVDKKLQDFLNSVNVQTQLYSEKNMTELSRRIADIEAGKNLTSHELLEDDV